MPLVRLDAADTLLNSQGQCRLAFEPLARNRSDAKYSLNPALGARRRSP
jgi:hypothetical protein